MSDLARATPYQRIFLTGEPGCGKTTVVKRVAELLMTHGFKVGGMISKEIREKESRKGFRIEDFITHEEGILAEIGSKDGPRVGKYTVNMQDLEEIGSRSIRRAIEIADVVLVDELGPMELNSHAFIESVEAALSSQKHVLGTIHQRTNHPFVVNVKSSPQNTILKVTPENRAGLPSQILERITIRR
jgi:nucleoside-triphosphatase